MWTNAYCTGSEKSGSSTSTSITPVSYSFAILDRLVLLLFIVLLLSSLITTTITKTMYQYTHRAGTSRTHVAAPCICLEDNHGHFDTCSIRSEYRRTRLSIPGERGHPAFPSRWWWASLEKRSEGVSTLRSGIRWHGLEVCGRMKMITTNKESPVHTKQQTPYSAGLTTPQKKQLHTTNSDKTNRYHHPMTIKRSITIIPIEWSTALYRRVSSKSSTTNRIQRQRMSSNWSSTDSHLNYYYTQYSDNRTP